MRSGAWLHCWIEPAPHGGADQRRSESVACEVQRRSQRHSLARRTRISFQPDATANRLVAACHEGWFLAGKGLTGLDPRSSRPEYPMAAIGYWQGKPYFRPGADGGDRLVPGIRARMPGRDDAVLPLAIAGCLPGPVLHTALSVPGVFALEPRATRLSWPATWRGVGAPAGPLFAVAGAEESEESIRSGWR